jgi:ABC-type nitrate/sulfonate/bicarbonate transport system permease component
LILRPRLFENPGIARHRREALLTGVFIGAAIGVLAGVVLGRWIFAHG